MRPLLVILLSLVVPACWASAAGQEPAGATPAPPNILIFLVDDLGWCDTSVVFPEEATAQHGLYSTPAMERLAREGVVFAQAYAASPVCSPTRCSILTGRNPARTRITNWIPGRGDRAAEDQALLVPEWSVDGLDERDPTLPRILRAVGYQTAHVGKAHLGRAGTPGADPTRLGFEHNVGGNHRGAPGSYLPPYANARGGAQVPHLEEFHETEEYLNDALTERALELIERMHARGRPWFLHFAHYAVHTPIQADPARVEAYRAAGVRGAQAAYASMIESVDASLGRVLERLDALGAARDTVILLFSDNGGLTAHSGPPTSNAPLASGKGSSREGGVRVPLIIRWPGVAGAGRRCAVPVISDDFLPTLARLAGVGDESLPSDLDGVDLGPVLRGADSLDRPLPLLWHYPHYWGWKGLREADPSITPFSSLRVGDWKIVHTYEDRRVQLYDLGEDPGETRNRAEERPELRDSLLRLLRDRLARAGAQTPRDRVSGEPLPLPGAQLVR